MDLTPQTLREVEFREKLRGYHPDDVDDFLEQAAVALDGLLTRLGEAEAAAAAAGPGEPTRPADRPVGGGDDEISAETLRRTLLLAQRTADAAVAEAEESARRVVEEARDEAARLLADAEARASTLGTEAKIRADASIADLEERRAGLEREIVSLQTWAAQQRDRLRDVLSDQVRALDIWLATSGAPTSAPDEHEAVRREREGATGAGDATGVQALIGREGAGAAGTTQAVTESGPSVVVGWPEGDE